ncbi:MAG: cadherin repeat domain-containing protein, partial [Marinifilaceae bacterium]|nr:cadherin repeat domain-containing protein [Marinifilaceae bacterium]
NYSTPHKFAVLSATDADAVSDFTNWQIVGGNPTVDSRKLFSINNSGEIFTEGELDNEAYTDAIVLEITVDDSPNVSTKFTSEKFDLSITIENKNEFKPIILSPIISSVDEGNYSSKLKIANFAVTDGDKAGKLKNWTISSGNILEGSEYIFSIDSDLGELFIKGKLDCESLGSSIELGIKVEDELNGITLTSEEKIISVKINDINEYAPIIEIPLGLEIEENNYSSEHILCKINARDADYTTDISNWEIKSGNDSGLFRISEKGELIVKGDVDYEKGLKIFNLGLQVSDGKLADSRISAITKVSISVVNVNDNRPIISGINNKSLFEDVAIDTKIFSLSVTDPDGSVVFNNWKIVSDNNNKFRINTKGEIFVNEKLDYETKKDYRIQVTVDDVHPFYIPNTSSIFELNIYLKDINDESPIIEENQIFRIAEDQTNIGVLKVTDPDGKLSSYKITGADANLFQLDISTLNLSLKAPAKLDYETKKIHVFNISISDTKFESKAEQVVIEVLNLNDNKPFINDLKLNPIPENTGINTILCQLTASDLDMPAPWEFDHWQIIKGNELAYFSLDSHTGELTLEKELNYDYYTDYSLEIVVYDGTDISKSHKSDSYILNLQVLNIEEERPVIRKEQEFYVQEDEKIIGELAIDYSGSKLVKYQIEGAFHEIFQIDLKNKVLCLKPTAKFDYEKVQSYHLNLSVSNKAYTSEEVAIDIFVSNINDNVPKIQEEDNQFLQVNKYFPDESKIGTIVARDPDRLLRPSFSDWQIVAGNRDENFYLNKETGELYIHKPGKLDRRERYILGVTVSDGVYKSDTSYVSIKNINIGNEYKIKVYTDVNKEYINIIIFKDVKDEANLSIFTTSGFLVHKSTHKERFIKIKNTLDDGDYVIRLVNGEYTYTVKLAVFK